MTFSYDSEKDTVTHISDGITLFPTDGLIQKTTFVFYREKCLFSMKNMCTETKSYFGEYGDENIASQETYRAILAWRPAKKYRKKILKEQSKRSNARIDEL